MFLTVLEVLVSVHVVISCEYLSSEPLHTPLETSDIDIIYRRFPTYCSLYKGCEVTGDGSFIDRRAHVHHSESEQTQVRVVPVIHLAFLLAPDLRMLVFHP
jgi:hypothetical protein